MGSGGAGAVQSFSPSNERMFVVDGPRVNRLRASCTSVTPIGAGRSGQAAPANPSTVAPMSGTESLSEEDPAVDAEDSPESIVLKNLGEAQKLPSGPPPTSLLLSTSKLSDKELASLFRSVLLLRPQIQGPTWQALNYLKAQQSSESLASAEAA